MFAAGHRAWGICDRCGLRQLLNELHEEMVAGQPRNNRVCSSCFDEDHPQNWLGKTAIRDYQALRFSRPDVPEAAVSPYDPAFVGPGNEP